LVEKSNSPERKRLKPRSVDGGTRGVDWSTSESVKLGGWGRGWTRQGASDLRAFPSSTFADGALVRQRRTEYSSTGSGPQTPPVGVQGRRFQKGTGTLVLVQETMPHPGLRHRLGSIRTTGSHVGGAPDVLGMVGDERVVIIYQTAFWNARPKSRVVRWEGLWS